jgi:hypothetical protein
LQKQTHKQTVLP